MKNSLLNTLVFGTLTSLSMAQTQIIIDFGDDSASGGNINNLITNNTNYSLIDYNTGLDTGADLYLSNVGFESTSNWSGGTVDWVTPNIAGDLIYYNSLPTTFTITNLPDSVYTVEVVSSWNSVRFVDLQVEGSFADYEFNGGSNLGDYWNTGAAGQGADDFLVWNSVSSVGGEIDITFLNNGDGFYALSGVRLTAVPEPSSYASVMGLLSIGSVLLRRRRR